MPIAVRCNCGKTLNVRDDLAGKAVKCPGCATVLRVPQTVGGATPSAPTKPGASPITKPTAPKPTAPASRPAASAAPTAPRPTANSAAGNPGPSKVPGPLSPAVPSPLASAHSKSMHDLYAESGFELRTGKFCPECNALLVPGAVLCVKCGFHLEGGTKLEGHKIATEEENVNAILKKAEVDMQRSKELQERLEAAGMPPWIMALILFLLVSVTAVGVITVNVSRRKNSTVSFNPTATLLLLAGIGVSTVGSGAQWVVIYRAFKESPKEGVFVLLIPFYVFYYVFTRFSRVGIPFIVSLVATGVSVVLFVLAGMSNSGQL